MTAIVVSWNAGEQLVACLEALLAQDTGLDVVVVDNASGEGTAAVLDRYERRGVRVVRNAENRGFAGAVNDGLAVTDAEAVVVSNADVVAAPDHVRRLVAVLRSHPRCGSVQGRLVRPGGRTIDSTGHVAYRARLFANRGQGQPDDDRVRRPGEVFGVTGALACYRRAMLDDVAVSEGGRREVLDEDLFAYFDDVDLDWRAQLRGWSARYEPAAVAVHERGGVGARRTAQVEQLNFRNRLLVIVKCDHPGRLAVALPAVVATTALKAAALLRAHPASLAAAVAGFVRLLPRTLAKRRTVQRRATVAPAAVVDRWFGPLPWRVWLAAGWQRVRSRGRLGRVRRGR